MNDRSTCCRNCGARLHGPYCHQCGQRQWSTRSIRHLVRHAVEETVSLDGSLVQTLYFLARPGLLTRAYLHGRRARLTPPLRLFFVASIVFFSVLWLTRPVRTTYLERTGTSISELPADTVRERIEQGYIRVFPFLPADHRINAALGNDLKNVLGRWDAYAQRRAEALSTGLLLLLPALVVILKTLYARRPWLDHAVFVTHYGAAFLVGFLVFMLIGVGLKALLFAVESYTGRLEGLPNLNVGLYSVFGVVLFGYLFASLRRVYGAGRWGTTWRCAALAAASVGLYLLADIAATVYALMQTG